MRKKATEKQLKFGKAVSYAIINIMTENQITNAELSRKTGICESNISQMRTNGSPFIAACVINEVCKGFGITLSEFFARKEFENI